MPRCESRMDGQQGKADTAEGVSAVKGWQKEFYSSKAWKDTRDSYKRSVGGLCEECWSKGILKAGELVHHKVPMTPQNINDMDLALGWDNLQCLCRECHAKVHDRRVRRYKLDELGRVVF